MQRIGMRDPRIDGTVTIQSRPNEDPWIARTEQAIAYTVRWPVFEGVEAEGLMVVPKQRDVRFCMVLIPMLDKCPKIFAARNRPTIHLPSLGDWRPTEARS